MMTMGAKRNELSGNKADKEPYGAQHARYYDAIYADKPYRAEAQFVGRMLERGGVLSGARVLELASGTGRHALELDQLGFLIEGSDASAAMVVRARERAQKQGARIAFRQMDMRALAPQPEVQPYDAVVCLFDSIGYSVSNEGVSQTLCGVRSVLRPGGLFVFEFWHAAAMLSMHEPFRVREFDVDGVNVVRWSKTRLDVEREVGEVEISFCEMRADGSYQRSSELHVNRFFGVQEMAALLAGSGMEPVQWFAGFNEHDAIGGDTWHVVGVARAPEVVR